MCSFTLLSCAEKILAFTEGILLLYNEEPLEKLCPLWPDDLGQELVVGFSNLLYLIDKIIKGPSLKVRKIELK